MYKEIPYVDSLPIHWDVLQNRYLFYYDGNKILTQNVNTFTAAGSLEIFAAYNNGTKGYLYIRIE